MDALTFANFFSMYPFMPVLGEREVILSILHSLKHAKKAHKEHKDGHEHIKHLAIAHRQMAAYFAEKGINPDDY